ncbi:putative peroxidase, partial [Tanacetum coccineum]
MYTFSPMMVANSRKHHCRVRAYTREVLVISTNLDIQKNHYSLDFTNRRGIEARIKNTWYNQGEDILRFGHLHDVFIELEDVLGYHRFDSSFNLINNDEKEKDKRVRGLVVLDRLLNLQVRSPSYLVEPGRLDGLSSTTASIGGKLPKPNQNLDQLNAMFYANGLTQDDMIALS